MTYNFIDNRIDVELIMKNNNKLKKLENKSIVSSIFIMSLPVVLGNMAMVIYNLTDAFFIGQLEDVAQLAASAFAYPLMMILSSLGAIFGIGGASYQSRSIGAGRIDLAESARSKAIVSALFIGFLIGIISQFFMNPIVKILGASDTAIEFTKDYASIILLASPIIMMNSVSIDMIRSEGGAKLAALVMIVGLVINSILDPIFILLLGMGVQGAAWATLIGNSCGFLFSLYCFKYKTFIKVKLRKAFEYNGILWQIIKVGLPSALNIILMSAAIIVTNNIADTYGEAVVAGMGLALRNHSIVIQLLLGFSMGTQPLIGYNYGKRDYAKVKKLVFTNMGIISIIGTITSVIFFVLAEPFISLFNSDPEVIYNGARGLRALLLCKPLISVFMVSMSSIQAFGKGFIALIFSVSRQLILFMVFINVLNYLYGFNGFIYAQALSDLIMIIFSGIVIIHVLKNLDKSKHVIKLAEDLE